MLLSSLYSIYVFFSPPIPLTHTEILFYAATADAFEQVETQYVEDIQLLKLDPRKPVKIICHGLADNITSYWYVPIRDAYLQTDVTNLIFVDWSSRAQSSALNAIKSVRGVGEIIANLILKISWVHKIPLDDFHLVGHSLGAHISGFAGKTIYELTKSKVGRITGLDPAGPTFRQIYETRRLARSDAQFVDVIHTDLVLFGNGELLGDADFYPNKGTKQNGCPFLSNCSHLRAPLYFVESIKQTAAFAAWKCSSYLLFAWGVCSRNCIVYMGEHVDVQAKGAFYLKTTGDAPWYIKNS